MPARARGAAAKAAANKAALESVPSGDAADGQENGGQEPAKKAAPAKTTRELSQAAVAKLAPVEKKEEGPEAGSAAATIAEQRAAKAAATRAAAEASGETQKCHGPCGLVKPITSFPTTTRRADGTMGRGKVCRACRDAGRKAAKATPAAAEAPAEPESKE